MPVRSTQHHLARDLGLSQATVSMALAGNPKVAKAPIERVREAAKARGHRRDPALRALARYRARVRPPRFRATLAWVHAWTGKEARRGTVFGEVFDAARWLERGKPDVLLVGYAETAVSRCCAWLRELGMKAPGDIGVATLCVPPKNRVSPAQSPGDLSGMDEQFAEVGSRGAGFLVQLLESFKRGETEPTIRHLVQGRWHEGDTLRPGKSDLPVQNPGCVSAVTRKPVPSRDILP